jgi:hypothetical protein
MKEKTMSILTNATLSNCLRFGFMIALLALLVVGPSPAVRADEIAIWNFNDSDLFVDHGAGSLVTSFATVGFAAGSIINARQGDPALQALSLSSNANNGQNLTLSVSTLGFGNLRVTFATQRTSTGFNGNQFQYSLDGTTFVDFEPYNPPGAFGLVVFDLSSITGLNNNPNAAFRIVFNGATSSTGNNRIDNLVVEGTPVGGTPVPEPVTLALLGTGLMGLLAARGVRKR